MHSRHAFFFDFLGASNWLYDIIFPIGTITLKIVQQTAAALLAVMSCRL